MSAWLPVLIAPDLRMIPVDPIRPPAETLDFVRRCTRCGAAKLELVRDCGQWVCADSCHQAWRRP